jgi:hypothetical protein
VEAAALIDSTHDRLSIGGVKDRKQKMHLAIRDIGESMVDEL